jgi:hypothetical protein
LELAVPPPGPHPPKRFEQFFDRLVLDADHFSHNPNHKYNQEYFIQQMGMLEWDKFPVTILIIDQYCEQREHDGNFF